MISKRKFPIILMIILLSSILFDLKNVFGEVKGNQLKITEKEFSQESSYCIIRYSNVIFNYDGKTIKIPMFNGQYGDVLYGDLKKVQKYKYPILSRIAVPIEDGKTKETFLRFLAFYKNSLLKEIDIKKPSVIGIESGDTYMIWYDFNYEGITSSMLISILGDRNNIKELSGKKIWPIQSIDQIGFSNSFKYFFVELNIGRESPFKKK